MAAPVLVTGLGRTGTTWVGRMLCLSGELNYLHEPFGFYTSHVRWPAPRLPSRSFYICRDNEADYYRMAHEHAMAAIAERGALRLRQLDAVSAPGA